MPIRRYVLMWLATLIGLAAPPSAHAQVSVPLPPVIHFCARNCWTLVPEGGGHYIASNRYSFLPADFRSTWTFDVFTPGVVVIHRHETPSSFFPDGSDVVYTGRLSSDGSQLIGILANGTPASDSCMSWGAALGLIPGSNDERDQRGQPACSLLSMSSPYPSQPSDPGGAVAMATTYVDHLETADLGWVYDNDMSPAFHATFLRPIFIGLITLGRNTAGGGHLTRDMIDAHPLPENTLNQPCACYFVRFRTTFPHGAVFQDISLEPVGSVWKVMASFATPTL